jgi:hypothetical protein
MMYGHEKSDHAIVVHHRLCRPTANETLIPFRVVGIEVDHRLVRQARIVVGPGVPGVPQTVATGRQAPEHAL